MNVLEICFWLNCECKMLGEVPDISRGKRNLDFFGLLLPGQSWVPQKMSAQKLTYIQTNIYNQRALLDRKLRTKQKMKPNLFNHFILLIFNT